MAALALSAAAACGSTDQEVSAGDGGEASSTDDGTSTGADRASSAQDSTEGDQPEGSADEDHTGDGATSSQSSSDADDLDVVSSNDGAADGDAGSDLDDSVSASNDGSGGGQDAAGGEQPVVLPDGSATFGPQQGQREPAVITDVQPVVRESWPLQLAVLISGELRDGCQDLAWEMTPDGTTYRISVWQVMKATEMACTMAIVPFETQVELGTSETEAFTVIVNDVSYESYSS